MLVLLPLKYASVTGVSCCDRLHGRGVSRNLFRSGTKDWVPPRSPAGSILARASGVAWAKPPKHEKYAENLIECHKFRTVQTKKFSVAISEGDMSSLSSPSLRPCYTEAVGGASVHNDVVVGDSDCRRLNS